MIGRASLTVEVLDERACVFVVPTTAEDPPTLECIKEHMLGMRIAKWKLPERLEVVDHLPMSAGGKIMKSELRELVGKAADTGLDRELGVRHE